jgi:outer membrane protein assembly factor BamB
MPTARGYHDVAVLNGQLYAVAGDVNCGFDIAAVEAYDPIANNWTTKAALPQTRVGLKVAVANGKLYALGGSRSFDGTIFAYDPASNTWTAKAAMPTPRNDISVAVVGDLLYVMGGHTQWQFNLDTKATGMSTGIWQLTATLSDGSQHQVWVQLK